LVQEALAVPPRIGRHLCFDGRWLHGAPASMRPTTADGLETSYERVTFCVNVWINHKPRQLRRFEAGVSASLMARHANDGAAAADLGLRAASAQAARAERQATGARAAHQRDLPVERLGAVEHLTRMLEEHPPEVGRIHARASALEQRHADALLQDLNAARQRRLRQVQRAGGTGEAAFLGEGPRMSKEPEVDGHERIVSKA
jgi:hypothetical protein